MKRLFSLFNKKALAVFFPALLIGLYSGGLFERYVFDFAFVPNFSTAEARQLNGKAVKETCYKRPAEKEKVGRIVGFSRDNYALVRVEIQWENDKTSLQSGYLKSYFSKCIEIVE